MLSSVFLKRCKDIDFFNMLFTKTDFFSKKYVLENIFLQNTFRFLSKSSLFSFCGFIYLQSQNVPAWNSSS